MLTVTHQVQTTPFLKVGKGWGGGEEGVEVWCRGQVFLKGGWGLGLLLFDFIKVHHSYTFIFTISLPFAKLCHAFEL